MAKIAFSKLNAKVNTDIKTIALEDGKEIEIIQYLPTTDKIALITRVIELAHDPEVNYMNPIKTDIYFDLELVQAYTNLSFTEKQLADVPKLYDAILSSGWLNKIKECIPVDEIRVLRYNISRTQNAYYAFRNSAAGILETISTDYSDLNLDIEELQKKLANKENIELVQSIVSRMG
jgi:hypothetical protein